MALQQVSLSGVIICPDQELEQRFAVNSFTVHLFCIIKATGPKQRIIQMWCVSGPSNLVTAEAVGFLVRLPDSEKLAEPVKIASVDSCPHLDRVALRITLRFCFGYRRFPTT